ncbi:immunity 70 family protein [Pseudoflavonifractor phocaeensis]|uniref:immunity 70 family protein n=1 Tax=Pseudoflavonifractor phocaeensis TaxID=1870988 RepID=UPI001956DC30|nr:immunity 70 family protein [Pseudoflavonifractor phocaeensis]MBM6885388.1 immunity 70 family protein [Pseudoflavonifractor phocaeensis]
MAVGFKVEFFWYQIGRGDFLHAFFSTVAYNLENGDWGSRFPVIMNELYSGKLSQVHTDEAIKELEIIKRELRSYGPENVVWEIEDLSKQPPWGNNISKEITDLSNYFVTSDGEDFLNIFMHALKKAKELNCELIIKSI